VLTGADEVIPPGCSVRVLYDYVATEKGVLSLRAGEVAPRPAPRLPRARR